MGINRTHIESFLKDKFSLLDKKKLDEYFSDENLNEETKVFMNNLWERFEVDQDNQINIDPLFHKLYYKINSEKESVSKRRSLVLRISQVAAILIVGVLISFSIYFSDRMPWSENEQQLELISHSGYRNQFKLPDGTTGWLGYESKLQYIVKDNQRVAILDGLAFFNVAHNKKLPFIVKTPTNLKVEVIGTRFNVTSYSKENSCEVVLEQGKVKLSLLNDFLEEMAPNDRIFFDVDKNTINKSTVDVQDFLAWKEGKLILNNITLEESCTKISRFYNVDVELVGNPSIDEHLRLVLEDESLEEAMDLVCLILPLSYEVKERSIQSDNSYSKKKIIIK